MVNKKKHSHAVEAHIFPLKKGTTTCVQWMLYKVEGSQLISRISNAIPTQDCYLFASENGLYEFDRNADLASLFPLQDIKIKWLCTVAHGCHNYRKAKRLRNLLSKPWNSGKETMTCSYPMAGRCFNAWMSHSFSMVPTLGTWTSLEILRKKKNIAAHCLYQIFHSRIPAWIFPQLRANKHLESLERHRLN